MALELMLDDTDATSKIFGVVGDLRSWGFFLHSNGGTWALQARDPDGHWHSLPGGEYDATGLFMYQGMPGVMFRFTGGTVGAKIWTFGAYS